MGVSRLINGIVAGGVATGPMTVTMVFLYRYLPWTERDPLPPRQITTRMAEEISTGSGLKPRLSESSWTTLTLASHFGYGALAGGIYAPLAERVPLPPVVKGIVFGLIVWIGSYLGWLPAVRILPPATHAPHRQNALMIVAHLVWGATTGVMVDHLEREVHIAGFGELESGES